MAFKFIDCVRTCCRVTIFPDSMYRGDFLTNEYTPNRRSKKDDIYGYEKCYKRIVASATDNGELLLYCTRYVEIKDLK